MRQIIFILVLLISAFPVNAELFITGNVTDAADGEPANGHEIVLWSNNPEDNLIDIIGPNGGCADNNCYILDCGLLSNPCGLGDTISLKVVDNGSGYTSRTLNYTITQQDVEEGFALMETISMFHDADG
ncbi:hypothetical protein D6745_00575, partial [Candidatus Woesearchaeota archaeon]